MTGKFKIWDAMYGNFVKDSLLLEFYISCDGQLMRRTKNTMRDASDEFTPIFSTNKTDKNGVELFDGDIVSDGENILEIHYKKENFCWYCGDYLLYQCSDFYVKIGNKFEPKETK